MVFEKTDILLPKIKDYRKWAVVACDQFTSQPEYWENVQKYIGDEVSTYNLILPEAQLSENNDDKIKKTCVKKALSHARNEVK